MRSLLFALAILVVPQGAYAADEPPVAEIEFTLDKPFFKVISDFMANRKKISKASGTTVIKSKLRSSTQKLKINKDGVVELEMHYLSDKTILVRGREVRTKENVLITKKTLKVISQLNGKNDRFRTFSSELIISKMGNKTHIRTKVWVTLQNESFFIRRISAISARNSLRKMESSIREVTNCPLMTP
jgi:hypothetical protein